MSVADVLAKYGLDAGPPQRFTPMDYVESLIQQSVCVSYHRPRLQPEQLAQFIADMAPYCGYCERIRRIGRLPPDVIFVDRHSRRGLISLADTLYSVIDLLKDFTAELPAIHAAVRSLLRLGCDARACLPMMRHIAPLPEAYYEEYKARELTLVDALQLRRECRVVLRPFLCPNQPFVMVGETKKLADRYDSLLRLRFLLENYDSFLMFVGSDDRLPRDVHRKVRDYLW
jgi:hypothetical protein